MIAISLPNRHQICLLISSSELGGIDSRSELTSASLFSLRGRVAVITGAGGGIGLAVADAFAEAGAKVVITYKSNQKAVEEAETICKRRGVPVKAVKLEGDPVSGFHDQSPLSPKLTFCSVRPGRIGSSPFRCHESMGEN